MNEVIEFELVDLAGIESHKPIANVIEELVQFLLVKGSDRRASSLPRGLVCPWAATLLLLKQARPYAGAPAAAVPNV